MNGNKVPEEFRNLIIEEFNRTTKYARVLMNNQPSPIGVKYAIGRDKPFMRLRNLRDLPPFIDLDYQLPPKPAGPADAPTEERSQLSIEVFSSETGKG